MVDLTEATFAAAALRGKQARANEPRAAAARYNRRRGESSSI